MRKPSLLFVVILVLLILVIAIVCMPVGFGSTKTKTRIAATEIAIRWISTALDTYKLHNDAYPTTEQGLKALLEKPTIPPIPKNWKSPYYTSKNFIDVWRNPYQYRCPSQHNRPDFDLWSFGPDGKDGTEDDFTNWSPFPKTHKDNTSDYFNFIIIGVIAIILFTFLLFPWKKESKSPPL